MNKVTIVFCEGDHDIALLIRLLSIHNYISYKKSVKDFPAPFNNLFIKILKNNKIEDRKFKFQRNKAEIPYAVLINNNELVIFHNLDGDGNILNGKAKEILKRYIMLNDREVSRIPGGPPLISFKFLYFMDADDYGVEYRLKELKNHLGINEIKHHYVFNQDEYQWGCYIFHNDKSSEKKGKLEDLLLQLMKPNNQDLFEKSENFLAKNSLGTERARRYSCEDASYSGSIQLKQQKSVISIAGQFQFSGSSNSVIIANSDYIKREDLENNGCCKNIMELFGVK